MKARLFNYLITLIIVGLALWAAVSLYVRYVEHPWTRDGQVRANIVGIAPRVSGPIIHVAVHDNQLLRTGDLLFEIDPSDFQAQVDYAAGQLQNDEATLKQQQQNLERQTDLYRNNVTARQDFQNAQDSFSAAQAQVISAKANLDLAKLNLSYTKVFAQIKALLSGDPHREKIQTQLAILPVAAPQAVRQIRIAGCSEEEKAKLVALVRALQKLITRISQLLSRRDRLPEITEQILKPQFERLEIEFKQMLDVFAECFRQGDCRLQLPTVRGALSEMDNAMQQIRDRNLLASLPFEAPLRVLDLVERYHATARCFGRVQPIVFLRGSKTER
jgi:multidrug efflux pump subunit AcrA (membrane-fusion protein)